MEHPVESISNIRLFLKKFTFVEAVCKNSTTIARHCAGICHSLHFVHWNLLSMSIVSSGSMWPSALNFLAALLSWLVVGRIQVLFISYSKGSPLRGRVFDFCSNGPPGMTRMYAGSSSCSHSHGTVVTSETFPPRAYLGVNAMECPLACIPCSRQ